MTMSRSDSLGSQGYTGFVKPTAEELARARESIGPDLGTRYRLRDYLGRGAFATVWHAYDVAAGVDVAVKRFHARGDRTRGFYRELSVLFRLRHPAIASIINLLEAANGTRYLILEYCGGGSLRAALSRARRAGEGCSADRAAELALSLAEGLQAAHAEGLAHRDVKPENILFDRPDAGPFGGKAGVKLADFGLAKLFESAARNDAMAKLSGSPAYMAPEQLGGDFGPASDIYALGVVLYEMLTGSPPFLGTTEELAYQHIHAPPPPAALPEPWPRWLGALLSKDPNSRPTLAAWIGELRRLAPVKRITKMNELPNDLNEALDRDLDRLQPALAALASLRLGKRPRGTGASLLERHGFAPTAAHPLMETAVDWEVDEPPPVAPPPPVASSPFPGLTESSPVYLPTAAMLSRREEEPVPEPEEEGDTWPRAGGGGSIDDVLNKFDWR